MLQACALVPTCMPCSQSSLINTFSSSWLMPSTLLGTRHMRDFGTGIADKAEEEGPLNWEKRQELLCMHQNGHTLTVHSERYSSLYCGKIPLMSWTLWRHLLVRLNCGWSSFVRYWMGGGVRFECTLLGGVKYHGWTCQDGDPPQAGYHTRRSTSALVNFPTEVDLCRFLGIC